MKPASAIAPEYVWKMRWLLTRRKQYLAQQLESSQKQLQALGDAAGPLRPVVSESQSATTSMFPSEGDRCD